MINIKYIKTAFSADCSKNFDGKNMVQIMGKICPIYVPYFAHGVFTLKVSERFPIVSNIFLLLMVLPALTLHAHLSFLQYS